MYDKRDVSIISSLKSENSDEIITDSHEVNRQIMQTIKELQVNLSKPQPKKLEFPVLKRFEVDEMKCIMTRL